MFLSKEGCHSLISPLSAFNGATKLDNKIELCNVFRIFARKIINLFIKELCYGKIGTV